MIAMKKKTIYEVLLAILIVFLLARWCGGGSTSGTNSSTPVGTYRADLTIMQSGSITTIVLKNNGSATMTQDGFKTEYTYWDYAGKGIDVRIATDTGSYYFMDFDEGMIYYGADNYRSRRNGNKFKKIK